MRRGIHDGAGELTTQILYLFSEWDTSPDEREMLWTKKRDLFEAVNYTIPAAVAATEGVGDGTQDVNITVQVGAHLLPVLRLPSLNCCVFFETF